MCKKNVLTIVAMAMLALAIGQVQAVTVTVPIDNPGFEDSVLADGEYDYSMDDQGWGYFANDGEQGSWNPGAPGTSEPGYGGNAPEGQNVGWANPGGVGVPGGFAQVLTDPDAVLKAGVTYTLTVEVGNTLGYPWGGYKVQLLAGGTPHTPGTGADYTGPVTGGTLLAEDNNLLTIAEDTIETSTVTYTYDPKLHSGLLGEPLQIRLLSLGNVAAGDYTEADFDNVRLSYTFLTIASNPTPPDKATDVPRDVVLSWTPGIYADKHDVYFGTNFDDVNDATTTVDPNHVYKGRQDVNSYTPAQRLDFGTTYYWRIDEVNAPPTSHVEFKGDVWSFTTEPFAYPIDGNNITATASSSHEESTGPENTVNGSGLDENDLHSTASTAMWLSSSTGPQPTWIQYEFDRAYKLHEMWVWNYNAQFEHIIGFGLKDVTVQYSTNGVEWKALSDVRFAWGPGAADYAHDTVVDFGGVVAKYVKITAKSNWGDRAQYGLSEVRFLYVPVWAREPSPDSGATGVGVDNATVSWRAGREAASHKVYFSASGKAVIDETVSPVSIPANGSYGSYNVGALDLGQTYYWKVNEVNKAETPTTWEGDVWNFRTHEFIAVDDFESYDDYDNRIFYSWRDGYGFTEPPPGYPGNGTGSTVGNAQPPYAEQTTVHSSRQSMPLAYDNSGTGGKARYSETFREWASPQDWTRYNVKALTLYFYGAAANAAEQLYVALEDNAAHIKVVNYPDLAAVRVGAWQEWNIALSEFSAAGVNLKAIKKMYIGLGNRVSPTAGGTGTIYIDDIRLYPARCLPDVRQPGADLNDDCVVDYLDLDVMVNHWLTSGYLVTPVDPGTAGLQAQYQFEGNTNDSSGKGRNGTAMGGPLFVAGKVGQAISLDGTDDYVTIAGYKGILADASGVQQPFTITAWVKTTDSGDRTIASWGTNSNMRRADFRLYQGRLRVEHGAGNVQGDTMLNDDNWHHVALTMIRGATVSYPDVQLWLDGKDNTRTSTDPDAFSITADVDMAIGYRATAAGRYFLGAIDDVRIYDRVLSPEEIVWLAGISAPFSEPFDLNVDGAVNFKDFAVLAGSWLEELLWP